MRWSWQLSSAKELGMYLKPLLWIMLEVTDVTFRGVSFHRSSKRKSLEEMRSTLTLSVSTDLRLRMSSQRSMMAFSNCLILSIFLLQNLVILRFFLPGNEKRLPPLSS